MISTNKIIDCFVSSRHPSIPREQNENTMKTKLTELTSPHLCKRRPCSFLKVAIQFLPVF